MTESRAHALARIIIRVKMGIASQEERDILGEWLDENEENRQLYKNIIRGKCIARRLRWEDEIYQTTNFKRVYREVYKRLGEPRGRRKLFVRISAGVAAACLCGVMLTWYYYSDVKVNVPSEVKRELAVVNPKVEKVMLVLEDGKQIGLESHVLDDVNVVQATLIGEKGRLSYELKQDSIPEKEIKHKIYTIIGGDYSLVLSDGTRVWLNAESELEYPVRFVGDERVVRLKGEAYFEVSRDTSKPFVVETGETRTRVLGTSFNISAYDNEEVVYTTLLSGKVEVSSCGDEGQPIRSVMLKPGMQSGWQREKGKFTLKKVDVEDVVAWRYGVFVFNEDDIEVVTRMLSRWYEVKFEFDGKRVGHHTFSGKMSKDEKLESILKMLTLAGGPEFKVEGKIVRIIEK